MVAGEVEEVSAVAEELESRPDVASVVVDNLPALHTVKRLISESVALRSGFQIAEVVADPLEYRQKKSGCQWRKGSKENGQDDRFRRYLCVECSDDNESKKSEPCCCCPGRLSHKCLDCNHANHLGAMTRVSFLIVKIQNNHFICYDPKYACNIVRLMLNPKSDPTHNMRKMPIGYRNISE
jgi:hypothetical protein